jgi:PRC-barrel domain
VTPLQAGLRCAAAAMLVVLSACSGLHRAQRDESPAPAVVNPVVTEGGDSETAASGAPSETTPVGGSETSVERPADASNGGPGCTCMEAKPSRPKPRPRPKPVHKEAPPQLPTAPVVAEIPPGGVVNAQVREMSMSVMSILGKRVQGPKGEDLGRVVDVLADSSGRVRVAIIDFGGFLGVGNHRIAVDWPLLRFNPDARDPSLLLSLTREKLQAAPEYKDNPRPQALMEPAVDPPASASPAVEGKK